MSAEEESQQPSPLFIESVQREVADLRDTYDGIANDGNAFAVWAIKFLHDLDDEAALDAADSRLQGSGDGGIDAIVADDPAQVIYLIQAKYSSDFDLAYDETAATELFAGLDLLLSEDFADDEGPEFDSARENVRAALEGDSEVVLQLVLAGRTTQEARDRAQAYLDAYENEQVRLEIVDAIELYKLDVDRRSGEDLAGVAVTFTTAGEVLKVPADAPGLDSAYIAILDGASLVDAVKTYRAKLVDLNLRFRLKTSRINDQIAASITDSTGKKQKYFSLLNNGLTITCSRIELDEGRIVLENPQIVNGGQTTMVLWSNGTSIDPGDLQILARVIATSGDEGAALAKEIAESTNRQNPITPADLKANDEIQKRIQSDFALLDPPWFYERRRNERASLSPARQNLYGRRIVTKEQIGQRWRAFEGSPANAVTAKQKMFEQQDLYGSTYSTKIDVRFYLLAHQLFEFFYYLLDGRAIEARKLYVPTMSETDRRELSRARNQWAAHCTAATAHLLGFDQNTTAPDSAYALALDLAGPLRNGEGRHRRLVRIVAVSGHKWFASRRASFEASDELFAVKAEFENTSTFEQWKIEVDSTEALLADMAPSGGQAS